MQIYQFQNPIILNDQIFSQYGGKGSGSFTQFQLQAAYQSAEQQTVAYIGTFLLPTIVTGVYGAAMPHTQRIATDYGYVHRILGVNVLTEKITYSAGTELITSKGGAFIYEDTFGYIDIYRLQNLCGCPVGNFPYQYQVVYEAGLPTGTANLPLMLQAMTMAAQIHLNEMFPGVVGMNEGLGDVGIQEFQSFSYKERRTAHALVNTVFGGSAMSGRITRLIRGCVKLARKSLKVS